ncbi:amidohydrolase [Nocardioides panacis]|uniref:Amidohydrolase n=1 Tax=Nocardioides panacis TaxID=2849501 RepID=A0A975SWX4_9ACTN|nr:amidohydrolase [Nocardioides panacis]QWZ06828.1 amidohydrolase [Nocardioides panacis]
MPPSPLRLSIDAVDALEEELVALRRDLHAHPELAWQETRTTALIAERLERAGLDVQLLPKSGLLAELGAADGPMVALRADLDGLPVDDRGGEPWVSTADGVAHACGHDVHTSALVGAGIALARAHEQSPLAGRVRLLFQPAEEVMPGGALEVIAAGALEGVGHVYGLHCDPTIDVGRVGLRVGPLTGAADALTVRLTGRGGHTSRPHLTEDLTYALGKLVTELPGALSRRLDPRAGASLVWGVVRAGSAKNVIPASGECAGTLRMLDAVAWADAEDLVRGLIGQILAPYGVGAEVTYVRGVPPVVNEPFSTALLAGAVHAVLGEDGEVSTPQSLGGEDFAWYLEDIPGAMGRLGTRTPGGRTYDLHQGDLHIDERAIGVGAKVLAGAVLTTFDA